ncbi:MAG: hypothetical protein PVH64_06070 [Bacillota bacterium]|jgi:hypothetical protein
MSSLLLGAVVISGGLVFLAAWHGLAGAIILGLDILTLDFCWQWVRWRRFKSAKRLSGWQIFFGFLLRVGSVWVGLKIGQAWLKPKYYWDCAAIALMLPLVNILGAYLFVKQRGFK